MDDRDSFVFAVLFLFQCAMLTAFCGMRAGFVGESVYGVVIGALCVVVIVCVPDRDEWDVE